MPKDPNKHHPNWGGARARKKKEPDQKVKARSVYLTDAENEYIKEKYGSCTKAIKTLIPPLIPD